MRNVCLNSLAFKAITNDWRESPIVLIAEHLIRKGFDLKIHDDAIKTSRITGANREYIEKRIPHLSSRLVGTLDELIEHSDILLVTRDGDGLIERAAELGRKRLIIDLRGRVPHSKKSVPLAAASKPTRSARAVVPKTMVPRTAPPSNGYRKP